MRGANVRGWTAAVLMLVLGACPEPGVGPGPAGDAGVDGGAAGEDGGTSETVWPEAELVLEGAINPSLAVAPDGTIRMAYQQDDAIWVRDLAGGAPVRLADKVAGVSNELRMVASPDEDRALVTWTGRGAVWLSAGTAESDPFILTHGDADLFSLSPSWPAAGPVLTARTVDLWYGGTQVQGKLFAIRLEGRDSVGDPSEAEALEIAAQYHHYGERERLLDLGDRGLLVLRMHPESDPDDPEAFMIRWWRLRTSQTSRFLEIAATGTFRGPDGARWIQPWDLGGGRYAMTWCATVSSMVFDVFVSELTVDETGTPSWDGAGTNVSLTTGATDNSDDPRLLPTGDGRFWMPWRETSYGPRVAILGSDLAPTRIYGPPTELEQSSSQQLDAVVDADGSLVLAATFTGDVNRVRVFRLPLP